MEISENTKPCLVTTPQGFSVSYNNKLLYSKYNPARAILQIIQNLNLLPGTGILCCSAVLDYGLLELQQKLPENCFLFRCDFNSDLLNFTQENTEISSIPILSIDELYNLPVILTKADYKFECGITYNGSGKIKRIIKLDFSAGTLFNSDLYNQLQEACTQAVLTWWANRLTLTKFGRRYSQNFFKNLKLIDKTTPIENYIGKISKPIIVCGAGESLNNGLQDFIQNSNDYFILCADTALQPLLRHKIVPDGVFIEEAQHVITKAFIGTTTSKTQIFAGLSSINQISHFEDKAKLSYYTTEFFEGNFINTLKEKNLLPPSNKPFGSVGLTAVYYALQFRKNDSIPVFIYGLDFSYSAGITHTKGALAHNLRLASTNRLIPVQNYGASFNKNSIYVKSKNEKMFYTSPVMLNYSKLFNSFFENTKNLYDSSDCGIPLNIPQTKPETTKTENFYDNINSNTLYKNKELLCTYFETERKTLLEVKDILTGKIKLPAQELEAKLTELIKPREYLYLHFADGWQFQYSQSFLNRVRTEIDFFLKIM